MEYNEIQAKLIVVFKGRHVALTTNAWTFLPELVMSLAPFTPLTIKPGSFLAWY
jgi:hypothetical protein